MDRRRKTQRLKAKRPANPGKPARKYQSLGKYCRINELYNQLRQPSSRYRGGRVRYCHTTMAYRPIAKSKVMRRAIGA